MIFLLRNPAMRGRRGVPLAPPREPPWVIDRFGNSRRGLLLALGIPAARAAMGGTRYFAFNHYVIIPKPSSLDHHHHWVIITGPSSPGHLHQAIITITGSSSPSHHHHAIIYGHPPTLKTPKYLQNYTIAKGP